MQNKQPFGSAIDALGASNGRSLALARTDANAALRHFARLLREWNDPDYEHTVIQLRAMLDQVIEEEVEPPREEDA